MSNLEIKDSRNNAVNAISDVGLAVLEGNVDPLSAAIALREVRRTIESVEKGIKSRVLEAAEQQCEGVDQGIYKYDGYEIQVQEGSGRYDFSGIEEIEALEAKLKDIKDRHKQAYKMHLKGQLMVDEDTGEIVAPAGYKGYGKQVRFTMKQKKGV